LFPTEFIFLLSLFLIAIKIELVPAEDVKGLISESDPGYELGHPVQRPKPVTFPISKVRYGKVKLSLCLTKHHAIKTYRSGGIAPLILDLGTIWR
jgi:hypothetical protein